MWADLWPIANKIYWLRVTVHNKAPVLQLCLLGARLCWGNLHFPHWNSVLMWQIPPCNVLIQSKFTASMHKWAKQEKCPYELICGSEWTWDGRRLIWSWYSMIHERPEAGLYMSSVNFFHIILLKLALCFFVSNLDVHKMICVVCFFSSTISFFRVSWFF